MFVNNRRHQTGPNNSSSCRVHVLHEPCVFVRVSDVQDFAGLRYQTHWSLFLVYAGRNGRY